MRSTVTTVRGEFHRLGIDRRRAMIYCVAEKWHSVTPPIVNFVGAYDWQSTHCVGDTHYKINVHQPIASALGGCRERNALFRTFFIFTLFRPPPEEGSPFVTIIKITFFFSWDLQSRLSDVSVFLLRILAIDSSQSNPITINVIDFVYVGVS